MAKSRTPSSPPVDPVAANTAKAAARNTDSGPAHPAPPGAAPGDLPAQKAADTQALAAAMPANTNKPLEHGEANALKAPQGLTATPPSRLPGGSTLSEANGSDKTGTVAAEGVNATIDTLDRVRVDSSGQRLTTNQGVPIADNQNSLKAGARGPVLLEDFILREKITHFDHERIPERVVHARGSGAHGYFQVYRSMATYTRAAFLQDPELKTPVASLKLYVDTLQMRDLPEAQRQDFYGTMLTTLERGRVRSISARRSRARNRPPPTLAGSRR